MKEADFNQLHEPEQYDNYISARASVDLIKGFIDALDLNNADLAKELSGARAKRKYIIPTPFDIVSHGWESVAVGNKDKRDYLEIRHSYSLNQREEGEDFYIIARNVDQNENHNETGSMLIRLSASDEIYNVEWNKLEPMEFELLLEGVKEYYPDIASGEVKVSTS